LHEIVGKFESSLRLAFDAFEELARVFRFRVRALEIDESARIDAWRERISCNKSRSASSRPRSAAWSEVTSTIPTIQLPDSSPFSFLHRL
jgi:hypothetical protein